MISTYTKEFTWKKIAQIHQISKKNKSKIISPWKLKYFTMQKYNLQKKLPKRNQNASRYYNSL
jgi:hypothetical protein